MKLKKYALLLTALVVGCAGSAATSAGAAEHSRDGTACISVTVDARSTDDGGADSGAGGENGGGKGDGGNGSDSGDKGSGDGGSGSGDSGSDGGNGGSGSGNGGSGSGSGGSGSGDSGSGSGDSGSDGGNDGSDGGDGGSGSGNGGSDGGNKGGGVGGSDSGNKGSGDKGSGDGASGSDGGKKDDGDKGSSGSKKDDGGRKDDGDHDPDRDKNGGRDKADGGNPDSRPADRDGLLYPETVPDRGPAAERVPDHAQETESGVGDGNTAQETGGRKDGASEGGRKDNASEGSPDSSGQETGDAETDVPKDDRGGIGISAPFVFFCCLAVLLAFTALLLVLRRRKKYFHGILSYDADAASLRGGRDRAVFVPALTEKLNQGEITFQEYEDAVMGSSAGTLLPADTKMHICVIHAGASETAFAGKADERRMFGELRKAADAARVRGQTVIADVRLEHAKKGIEIPLHFVFRK